MASSSELTLEYKPNTNPNTYPLIQNQPEQTQKLQDFVARLEEERLKIEAFKRELPLCMQLLNNAMETYKRQLETLQRPAVLEEFIPLDNGVEKSPAAASEKANWMVSAQLWSPASDHVGRINSVPHDMSTNLSLDTKQRNGGGAFLPFCKRSASPQGLPELALASAEEAAEEKKFLKMESVQGEGNSSGKSVGGEQAKEVSNAGERQAAAAGGQNTPRKARRCWSPDLHRRFINALQVLGGSQVATPKQIRELMEVDGLTNDEVKSHLQKYRLHTRRPIQQPQPAPAAGPHFVVLGGIWVPPDYATSAAAAAAAAGATGAPTIYPSPTAATAALYPVPHDFYGSPAGPIMHHHLHRAEATATISAPYKARVHSPESELRSGGDRSESIEEGEEGEDREVDDEEEEEEEEREEVKANDKALVQVHEQNSGNGSDVALRF